MAIGESIQQYLHCTASPGDMKSISLELFRRGVARECTMYGDGRFIVIVLKGLLVPYDIAMRHMQDIERHLSLKYVNTIENSFGSFTNGMTSSDFHANHSKNYRDMGYDAYEMHMRAARSQFHGIGMARMNPLSNPMDDIMMASALAMQAQQNIVQQEMKEKQEVIAMREDLGIIEVKVQEEVKANINLIID